MRELNGHKVNPANDVLTVHVLDELPRDAVSDKVLKVHLRRRFAGC